MIKKKGLLGIISAFFILKLIPLVSAYSWGYGYFDLRQGSEQVIRWIEDFAAPFFEILIGEYSGGEFFFAKCLMLILLFVIIIFVLEKSDFLGMKKNRGVSFLVSLIMSILAVRFIPETEIIRAMILPYNVMGIAILSILPFILYFFFIQYSNLGSIGRRLAWSLYAIIFGVLWYNRYDSLSTLGNQIYGWMLALVIICMIFDKQIHEYFGSVEFKDARNRSIDHRINALTAHVNYLRTNAPNPMTQRYQKEINEIEDEILRLGKSKS
jgi:hypothetical protein